MFDYYTLERMLQFIYEGDYTVHAASLQVGSANVNGKAATNGDPVGCVPPHRRHRSARSRSASPLPHRGQLAQEEKTIVTNTMTAHVLVYGIAEYYQLPDLKALSFKKFKEDKGSLSIVGFLALTKAVYRNTTVAEDPLRQELLNMLLAEYKEWLSNGSFSSALANDVELHEFAVAVVAALSKRLRKKSDKDKIATEAQATASKLLLSDLDQANEGLARSSKRIRALEDELKVAKVANQNTAKAKNELNAILDQTKDKLVKAERCVKTLADETCKLQVDLKNSQDWTTKSRQKASIAETLLKNAKDELEQEKARANKNYELCNMKDVTIQQEKARADLCEKANDAWTIRYSEEQTRADKAVKIIQSTVSMVNSVRSCDDCGESLNFKLVADDRTAREVPFNSMLQCCNCCEITYGRRIP